MFEAAELGRKLSREEFDAQLPDIRARLLQAQFALRTAAFPVIVVISGVDGAGKGEVVHTLNEWLDPRGIDTHAFWRQTDEEAERPRYWRYWRALPPRGRIAILFSSWYSDPIVQRVYGTIKNNALDRELDRIAFFERMLADSGALIIKLWFHLSKDSQRRRLKKLEDDPKSHFRVLPQDWKNFKRYDRFIETTERVIRHTDAAWAPWHLIESVDPHYRNLTAARIILESVERRLKDAPPTSAAPHAKAARTLPRQKAQATILDHVDLSLSLSDSDYRKSLKKWQAELSRLSWDAYKKKRPCVLAFEGWDAAGKGSAIRRVSEAIDPRLFRIVSIAAPTDEERARHYLWRFWRHLPMAGRMTLFDRSWYGRVLVERVEAFATETEWSRAYLEINEFEEQLFDGGVILAKFWIHISKEEQMRRFKERQAVAYKQHKITDEDWRNRKKWDAYKTAVNDMVAHTSTEFAPWTLVAGNDKKFARIQILKTLCRTLEKAL
jgi:polyphosphate:AMP phosphotransferase